MFPLFARNHERIREVRPVKIPPNILVLSEPDKDISRFGSDSFGYAARSRVQEKFSDLHHVQKRAAILYRRVGGVHKSDV